MEKTNKAAWALTGTCAMILGLAVYNFNAARPVHGQTAAVSTTPATVMAAKGDPITLGVPCGVGQASNATASFFTNRNVGANANATWRCVLLPDDVTYSWLAPFSVATPSILGSTTSIGGGVLLLGGNVSGTATVTGATVGSNCIATRADGTLLAVGMVIDCAVSSANTATVRISALIAGTPASGVYQVRVVN